jgi:hypothetical protein
VLLRGERRFKLGDPLAQGGYVLGQRHRWGHSICHQQGSSLERARHVLDQHHRRGGYRQWSYRSIEPTLCCLMAK